MGVELQKWKLIPQQPEGNWTLDWNVNRVAARRLHASAPAGKCPSCQLQELSSWLQKTETFKTLLFHRSMESCCSRNPWQFTNIIVQLFCILKKKNSQLTHIKDCENAHTHLFIKTSKIKKWAGKTNFFPNAYFNLHSFPTGLTKPEFYPITKPWPACCHVSLYTLSQNTAAGCSCASVDIIHNHS